MAERMECAMEQQWGKHLDEWMVVRLEHWLVDTKEYLLDGHSVDLKVLRLVNPKARQLGEVSENKTAVQWEPPMVEKKDGMMVGRLENMLVGWKVAVMGYW